MSILADYGCDEQTYIDQAKHRKSARPPSCLLCGGNGYLIGHGDYLRKTKGENQAYFIWVKCWLCKICHRTLPVIPNFLLPYRHYLVQVVQAVVVAFYERGSRVGNGLPRLVQKMVCPACAQCSAGAKRLPGTHRRDYLGRKPFWPNRTAVRPGWTRREKRHKLRIWLQLC